MNIMTNGKIIKISTLLPLIFTNMDIYTLLAKNQGVLLAILSHQHIDMV